MYQAFIKRVGHGKVWVSMSAPQETPEAARVLALEHIYGPDMWNEFRSRGEFVTRGVLTLAIAVGSYSWNESKITIHSIETLEV